MKKGLIKITDTLYKNDWSIISAIFKDFRPTHIEFRYWENDIWYFWGTSDLFDDITDFNECQSIPIYDVIFTKIGDSFIYEFKRA